MNKILVDYAKKYILDGLSVLPEKSTEIFKKMYSPMGLDVDINMVVDKMPTEKLNWAMQQVENSLKKLKAERSCHGNT